jgi:hypothetical protein
MKKEIIFLAFIVSSILLFGNASAQENETDNITISSIEITNFYPSDFKIGDVQFNIQIKNNNNETINDVIAFITGSGYSTYDVVPIASLEPGNKDYIFVSGHFRDSGNLILSIKIFGEIFYKNVSVADPTNTTQKELEDLKKQQEKTNLLNNLSIELKAVKQNLTNLEDEISRKKEDNYDVSVINLNDLKDYIKSAQTNIFEGNANEARINLNLAIDEYAYQKNRLDNAKTISIWSIIRENAVFFTAIAGAIVMFFTLYELLKRKSTSVMHATTKIIKKRKKKKI